MLPAELAWTNLGDGLSEAVIRIMTRSGLLETVRSLSPDD